MQNASESAPTHAQRVIRLRSEFQSRYERFRSSPELWPLVERLMLLRPSEDNGLSDAELDRLDRAMQRLRLIRARFQRVILR